MSHRTTWTMAQKDVNIIALAKQYTSFAFQVESPTTWITQSPEQEIDLILVPRYGVYVSPVIDYKKDSVLSTISRFFPIELKSSYSWTGSDMVQQAASNDDSTSIEIANSGPIPCTFGLTMCESDQTSEEDITSVQKPQPISAIVILPGSSHKFTPSLNLLVKMGRDQKTAGLITNIGRWTNFTVSGASSKYVYDSVNSVWAKAL